MKIRPITTGNFSPLFPDVSSENDMLTFSITGIKFVYYTTTSRIIKLILFFLGFVSIVMTEGLVCIACDRN